LEGSAGSFPYLVQFVLQGIELPFHFLKGTVKLARSGACGTVMGMSTTSNPYRGYRFPAEIINQAVWLYHCFSLSLREVELILAARGVVVGHETIREWSLRFGRTYAKTLKQRRP
jgi:putative transposase